MKDGDEGRAPTPAGAVKRMRRRRPKITREEWVDLTQKLVAASAQYFKPKEHRVLQDFIATSVPLVEKVQNLATDGKS